MLGCSGRTVLTRGAGTTPAWAVPGAWPGSRVHVALSSVSQQSLLGDFLGGRDSSDVLAAGGAENTKGIGVPPGVGTCFLIGGGTGCTGPCFLFSGISACAFDGERKFLVTGLTSCLNTLGVASPDASGLAIRGSGLGVGVKFRLSVAGFSGVGVANCELPGSRGYLTTLRQFSLRDRKMR